ncbi:MAG: hypothetical protein E5W95_18085 [Mesorhizobium sp.]|nr:MAG: hypothetical protein E5W95_18085 [Mesorhizobium sp.]
MADVEASELVNIMLKDTGWQPLSSPIFWQHHVERLQDYHGAAHCYVEVTEIEVAGALPGDIPDHVNDTVDTLVQAESFISGFEDDEQQKDVGDILAGLRAAIPREQGRPDLLAVLKLAVTDWPQFDVESSLRRPGCQEDDVDVNGGDLVEWFGNWRRAFVLPAIAKAEGRANG